MAICYIPDAKCVWDPWVKAPTLLTLLAPSSFCRHSDDKQGFELFCFIGVIINVSVSTKFC